MVALTALVVDQVTKAVVRAQMAPTQTIPVIDGIFHLTYVRNTGAAFGLMSGQRPIFILTGVIVLVAVAVFWVWQRPSARWLAVALALVVGGASGNLVDRVARMGLVTDFFDLHVIPVFNIADTCIVVGVGMLVVWILVGPETGALESAVESGGPLEGASPAEGETRE